MKPPDVGLAQAISGWWNGYRHHVIQLAGNISILTAQRVVQRLAGFASIYFLVRHLTYDDFGQYQFVAVVLAAVAFMALPGLDNAVLQSVARGSSSLYRRALGFTLKFSILGSVVLAILALGLGAYQPATTIPLLVCAALFVPYTAMAQWKSVLLAEARFLRLAIVECSTALFTHASLIAAVVLDSNSLWVFVLIFMLPTAIVNVAATAICLKQLAGSGSPEDSHILFRYGLVTSMVTTVSIFAEQVERLVIFLLISPASLAIYFAGDRLADLVRSVFQDAAAVLAARFAQMSSYDGAIERVIWAICGVAGVTIVLFAFTLAPTVLVLIFGTSYSSSIPFAQALLCSVAIGNVGQFQFRFIRSQPDSISFRNITLWTSGARIVGSPLLIMAFGVWGAIASLLFYRLALSVLSSAIIRRRYRSAPNV